MTMQEFAAKIRAKYPQVYDNLDDFTLVQKVVSKYPTYKSQIDDLRPNNPLAEQLQDNPAAGEEKPVEQKLAENAEEAGNGMATGYGVPAIAKGAVNLGMKGAEAIADGIGATKTGAKVGDMLSGAWNTVTGNTPRAFGYAQSAAATPEARELAESAIDMANKPQPELGKLVAQSEQTPGLVPAGTELPPTTSPDAFNAPVRSGMFADTDEMFNNVQAQRQQVGKAIENTLGKYDASGTHYDPSQFNNQIKGMLERDASGQVMSTGWQGEVNEAIKKAASSINDFSRGGPIKWSDAARIKTGLQGDTNYAVAGFNKANEAYKQVASLLKEDIDKQAAEMIAKQGGNVGDYQMLRQAYGKLDSLSDALNVAAKRKFTNSAIPWWVKMGAGAALGSTGGSIIRGITGH